jgi:hypothetical protein
MCDGLQRGGVDSSEMDTGAVRDALGVDATARAADGWRSPARVKGALAAGDDGTHGGADPLSPTLRTRGPTLWRRNDIAPGADRWHPA